MNAVLAIIADGGRAIVVIYIEAVKINPSYSIVDYYVLM